MSQRFEFRLIAQCAPTLAGVKPANLFQFRVEQAGEGESAVRHWSRKLQAYGISIRMLKACPQTSTVLVYVYREKWLASILSQPDVQSFLLQTGYKINSCTDAMLEQLSHRLCMERDFPHEIGVFLGYPLGDVIGFIDNKGQNFTCSGHWKSYGDPVEAEERFQAYRSCTQAYREQFEQGTPILQLVVAA